MIDLPQITLKNSFFSVAPWGGLFYEQQQRHFSSSLDHKNWPAAQWEIIICLKQIFFNDSWFVVWIISHLAVLFLWVVISGNITNFMPPKPTKVSYLRKREASVWSIISLEAVTKNFNLLPPSALWFSGTKSLKFPDPYRSFLKGFRPLEWIQYDFFQCLHTTTPWKRWLPALLPTTRRPYTWWSLRTKNGPQLKNLTIVSCSDHN